MEAAVCLETAMCVTLCLVFCSNSKDKAATTLREHTPKELRLIREAINQVPSDQLDTMRHEARQKIEEEGAAKCNRTYNEEDLEEKFVRLMPKENEMPFFYDVKL